MSTDSFDTKSGHRYFSADYFNRVWGHLDKKERSAEEDEQMISMGHASIAHWRDREDCGSRQLSIGYWQLSRIYAVVGDAESARRYGRLCLDHSEEEPPFYLGFAYEALARAEKIGSDAAAAAAHLAKAQECLAKVEDEGERKMLQADLDGLAG